MLLCTVIVFVFSILEAASKGGPGSGAQGTINALMWVYLLVAVPLLPGQSEGRADVLLPQCLPFPRWDRDRRRIPYW